MSFKMELEGAKELARTMKDLPNKVEKKIARKALRKGTQIVQKAAREDVPIDTGLLKKTLKIKTMKRKVGRVGQIVQASPRGLPEDKQFYASFVQYGSKKRKLPPNPFLLRAIERTAEKASTEVVTETANQIAIEAKKSA